MANAILVIDMVRGFCEKKGSLFCGETVRRIIPNIRKLLDWEAARASQIFFLCDEHASDDLEFRIFPPHCVVSTWETEVIPELSSYPGERIPKNRYSGFFGTRLHDKLEELRPEKLIICGVCTDICVCHTVADARNRDYEVEVPADCVASFDETAHRFALGHMEKVLGAKIINQDIQKQNVQAEIRS